MRKRSERTGRERQAMHRGTARSPDAGSVSLWIRSLRQQRDQHAANFLFRRYFDRLVARLKHRLNQRVRSVAGSDDVAQETLAEVLQNLQRGRYPALGDRESLWALIIDMAEKRSKKVWRFHTAHKRDVRKRHRPSHYLVDDSCKTIDFDPVAERARGSLEVEIQDLVQYLNDRLSQTEYRDLLSWELQGYRAAEMKANLEKKLGRPLLDRTVRRWRERMREELRIAFQDELSDG